MMKLMEGNMSTHNPIEQSCSRPSFNAVGGIDEPGFYDFLALLRGLLLKFDPRAWVGEAR